MTTQTATYIVHCHFCGMAIRSANHTVFDDAFPCCALCELHSLMHDGDFAWTWDAETTSVITPDDEEWYN